MERNLRHYLIDWLNARGYNALDELAQFDIRVGRDASYPNLFNLKYGSVMADKANPLVCACRGAIVELVENDGDHSPYYRLVAYAFDRFFNIGESNCHELNWSRTKVYEKYDGSLIKLFFYNGDWIVSTSGSVAAASDVGSTGRSFAELFWLVFDEVGYSREWLNKDLCYVFELCHKDNRIVVEYAEPQLPLLAVRDRCNDFVELDLVQFCESTGFNAAQSYDFGSVEGLMAVVNDRGADHEGFILFDGVGRAKAKSDVYCQLHRVRGNGSPDFSELFLNDDLEEFLLHFPEYLEEFEVHLRSIDMMEVAVESMMLAHNHLNQKDFAQAVLSESKGLSGACFALRSGKVSSFGAWLEGLSPAKLDALLGIV
jgi:hypothetical protein